MVRSKPHLPVRLWMGGVVRLVIGTGISIPTVVGRPYVLIVGPGIERTVIDIPYWMEAGDMRTKRVGVSGFACSFLCRMQIGLTVLNGGTWSS